MTRKTVHYSGHVQGVGFRFTTQQVAEQYAVTGFVRNLPDGTVEMVVEGMDTEIDRLIEAIQERMASFIRKANIQPSPPTGEFSGFSIRH